MEKQSLLCHDCNVYGVHVKASSIQHLHSLSGLISTKHLAEEETSFTNTKILLYSDVAKLFDQNATCGEGEIFGAETCLKKYAIKRNVEIEISHGNAINVWIFLVKARSIRLINDSRYLNYEKPALSDDEVRSAPVVFNERFW